MSKITTEEIKVAIEELFDTGGWEMDVSADVKAELDKRMPILTKITTALNDRVKVLEAEVRRLSAAQAASGGQSVAAAALSERNTSAPSKITVKLGGRKESAA